MKLIVGLGNPGTAYAASRHNAGYMAVKEIARAHKLSFKRDFGTSSVSARFKSSLENIIVALPLTYMNLSGNAVKALLRKHKIDISDLLIVCDDLDLEFGRLKLRPSGSSGGHRGLDSIIGSLGTNGFCRLRIGIGRPGRKEETVDFVLTGFSRDEKEEVPGLIKEAAGCCLSWVKNGVAETMNSYNKKRSNKDE